MPFPEPQDIAAIRASLVKFEKQISTLGNDTNSRRQCRAAANDLMSLLQALVNRLRD